MGGERDGGAAFLHAVRAHPHRADAGASLSFERTLFPARVVERGPSARCALSAAQSAPLGAVVDPRHSRHHDCPVFLFYGDCGRGCGGDHGHRLYEPCDDDPLSCCAMAAAAVGSGDGDGCRRGCGGVPARDGRGHRAALRADGVHCVESHLGGDLYLCHDLPRSSPASF